MVVFIFNILVIIHRKNEGDATFVQVVTCLPHVSRLSAPGIQYATSMYGTIRYTTVRYGIPRYGAVWYGTDDMVEVALSAFLFIFFLVVVLCQRICTVCHKLVIVAQHRTVPG